jgi:hypothetical protein
VPRYKIYESASGDELGAIAITSVDDDEAVIGSLVEAGYLDPPADSYHIDDGHEFSDVGERVIVDWDGQPVLALDIDDAAYDDIDGADSLAELDFTAEG